jgi:transcriptional regulator with XRE-family HTH domain
MVRKSYRKLFEDAREHLDYWVAGAEIEFTEELFRVMEEKKVNRSELARRIGTSQAYVTKVLRGNANFTLSTMVKLARALEMDVKIHLAPPGAHTVWKDDLSAQWNDRGEASLPSDRAAVAFSSGDERAVWFDADRYELVIPARHDSGSAQQGPEVGDAKPPVAA